jgi:hypothetical protein
VLLCCSINWVARCFPNSHYWRVIGIKVFIENPGREIKLNSIKLLIETYFEMGIAVYLNIYAFYGQNEFGMFFTGASNIVNSVLTIIWAFMMIALLLYSH